MLDSILRTLALTSLMGGLVAQVPTAPQVFQPTVGQTSFTLSTSATATTLVYRNGTLLYSPADYSISGNILTLVTPACQSDVIQVQQPSSYILTDEVNRTLSALAQDVNHDGHPGSSATGRLTGSGPYTLHYDLTPPSGGGSVELSFLDNATGSEKASISFNDMFGVATLNGFTNPWQTASYCTASPIDSYTSTGPVTVCAGYTALTQVLYTLFTESPGTSQGTATLTISWSDRITGLTQTYTSTSINLQTLHNSVTSSVILNSSANITFSVTVSGNADHSAVFHAEAKAIY